MLVKMNNETVTVTKKEPLTLGMTVVYGEKTWEVIKVDDTTHPTKYVLYHPNHGTDIVDLHYTSWDKLGCELVDDVPCLLTDYVEEVTRFVPLKEGDRVYLERNRSDSVGRILCHIDVVSTDGKSFTGHLPLSGGENVTFMKKVSSGGQYIISDPSVFVVDLLK